MRKIVILFLFLVGFLSAKIIINESVSDVYFANGVNTNSDDAAQASRRIMKKFEISYPNSYKYVASWKVAYNHTQGIGIDLYESMLQKIEEDWRIEYTLDVLGLLDYTYSGIAKMAIKKVAKKEIEEFAAKQAAKIAEKLFVKYGEINGITQIAIEYAFKEVFNEIITEFLTKFVAIPEEDIKRREQADIKKQFTQYTTSIKNGHGVVVIAHSQGNFFTNIVFDMFENHWLPWEEDTEWMKPYFRVLAVASPANNVIGESEPHITFDNDIINLVPNNLPWNIKNPTRYYFKNAVGEKIENIWSLKAHGFLTSYMKEEVTRKHILGFIRNRVDEQTYDIIKAPSQYKIKKEFGCLCNEKYIKVEHKFDKDLSKKIEKYHIKNFAGEGAGKIYPVDGEYVRAKSGGERIEEMDDGDVCLVLSGASGKIGEISGAKATLPPNVKMHHGAIDMILNWNHSCDIDMNLYMKGSKYAKQDIKDIPNLGKEHIYIPEVYQVFPGDHYIFSADGKRVDGSSLQESELEDDPVEIRALLETPSGSYFKVWEAQSFGQLDLGEFADVDIKYKECPALNGDKNWTRVYNSVTKEYQCLHCKSDNVLWQDAIYEDSWEYDSSCNLKKVKKLLKQAQWYCDCRKDPLYANSQHLYNKDTGMYQCLNCKNVKWQEKKIEHKKITCSQGNSYEWDEVVRLGNWYCPGQIVETIKTESTRTYDKCDDKEKKQSCGCVPCEYIVSGMQKRVENGPIAKAEVTIIKAADANRLDPEILYYGQTTDDDDIFKSGFIKIPKSKLDKFDDETYYIVRAKGGEDIDRDDDMHRDINPTENKGVIHAIIKGSDLKNLPYRVNILTEAIYQVAGGNIGEHYDANALSKTLNDISRKLLKKKLYPGDDETSINYHDILLWTPAVDKKALYKPFKIYVEPIIEKLYANKERYEESYHLIYDEYNTDTPELSPLSLEIPSGLPNGTTIAHITTYNHKPFKSIELKGRYADQFKVDDNGNLKIAKSDLIRIDNKYELQMRAIGSDGIKGEYVGLNIKVTSKLNLADPDASIPLFVSAKTYIIEENAPAGTLAAKVKFSDENNTIESYHLSGKNAKDFVIDNNGNIKVASGADIDYEKYKEYQIKVSAINSAGNESYPVSLSIPIKNQPDTPLFDLVVFEHVMENSPIGTKITQIRQDRKGLGKIEKFEILSPNIPFEIDNNGTLIVSDYIDYEQKRKYDFYAVAVTPYGNSNKIEIHITVDDQKVEDGLPVLHPIDVSVDENISSKTVIAKLQLEAGAAPIKKIILYGDEDKFAINPDGTLYLKEGETLDYEKKNYYNLKAIALNKRGFSNKVDVKIHIINVPDTPPTLQPASYSIEENIPVGSVVGKIKVLNKGEGNITNFMLSGDGAENFSIDKNGTIRTAKDIDYERRAVYNLFAEANSSVGVSKRVDLTINILNIPEKAPVLNDMNISIAENASIGSILAKVLVAEGGDTAISSYELNGTDWFGIDNEGIITLQHDLNWSQVQSIDFNVTAFNDYGASNLAKIHVDILRVNYEGTDRADTFEGSQRDEYFDAKGGDDLIYAGSGNDRLIGGVGNDYLNGGSGDDVYIYHKGDGNDTIEDNSGDDRLYLKDIDKNMTSYILDDNDLLLKFEDNATIRISNWVDNNYKIEHFIYEDGEVTSDIFDRPIVKPDAAIADLSKLGNSNAAQVVQGWIVPLGNGNLKVDHWIFNFEGGELIIDTLSELNSNGHAYIDIDGDGKQLGIDLYIYLFKKDSNGNWQYIASDDDSSQTYGDGSTHNYDSYMKLNLDEGEYLLAIGNYPLSSSAALNGENSAGSYGRGGAYQITFNHELEFIEMPTNANGNLYGSDHFNYYVLKNDIDPYNGNELHIENPEIVDENGTVIDTKGYVESYGTFISYYPNDAFGDINGSEEVNIVYDVVNRNDNRCKSLLSIQVIPSLYERQKPKVNSMLWNRIKAENGCDIDFNITKR